MYIEPMLLDSRSNPFNDPLYAFEPKSDGHRLILSNHKGERSLWTRHANNCSKQYPELLLPPIADDVVLDGEVCCANEHGIIDFELVMDRFRLKKEDKIHHFSQRMPVNYMVWDCLFYRGRDLRMLPLHERRAILETVIQPNPYISIVPHIIGRGMDLWNYVVAQQWEGIVCKRLESRYFSGKRSAEWVKVINYQYVDVFIAGFRKDRFGWIVHIEEGGELRPAGLVEFATKEQRKVVNKQLLRMKQREDKQFVYVEPTIKLKVKFRNWTRNGFLRSPAVVQIAS